MADLEDYQICDMCGTRRFKWAKFCTLCGIDYCEQCEIAHAAQHEFVAEAMGEKESQS